MREQSAGTIVRLELIQASDLPDRQGSERDVNLPKQKILGCQLYVKPLTVDFRDDAPKLRRPTTFRPRSAPGLK